MKGRRSSGRREGKGRLRLIGTHSASVLPAKEVRGELLWLRAAGLHLQVRDLQRRHRTTSTILFSSLVVFSFVVTLVYILWTGLQN